MTTTSGDNHPAPEPLEVAGRVDTAHREVDELLKLGIIGPARTEQLKKLLTAEAIEQHEQDGMSISDMVDMYRDLTDHP